MNVRVQVLPGLTVLRLLPSRLLSFSCSAKGSPSAWRRVCFVPVLWCANPTPRTNANPRPAEDIIARTDRNPLIVAIPRVVTLIATSYNRVPVSISNDPSPDDTSTDRADSPSLLSNPTLKGATSPSHGRTIVDHNEHATPPPGKSYQSPFYQHHS